MQWTTALLDWDCRVEKFLNEGLAHPWLDRVMSLLSSTALGFVVAAGLVALALIKRHRGLGRFLVLALAAVAIADTITFQVLKPYFMRIRPCHTQCATRWPQACGSPHGFPSNHAANSAAVATLAVTVIGGTWGGIAVALALGIGFSRLYLGAHYPGDVLAGYVVGALVALTLLGISRQLRRPPLGRLSAA